MGVIKIKTLEINSQEFLLDSDIEKGFLKGSIWANLYSPYKYMVEKIENMNNLERLIYMLQVYTFASTELTLYIITHPNNKEAIDTLKRINAEKRKMNELIETKYGGLSASTDSFNGFLDLKPTWSVR